MYTDLDLLLARLEAQENGGQGAAHDETTAEAAQGGENYDVSWLSHRSSVVAALTGHPTQDFLLLSDVLGQAVPAGVSPAELESLTVARVECERRRVTKSGKVKSKLSVVGVRCVDCAVSRRRTNLAPMLSTRACCADRNPSRHRSASRASKSTSSPWSSPNACTCASLY